MNNKVPAGFETFLDCGGYISHSGPFYAKDLGGGEFRYGFVTDERHVNPNNVVHGGVLTGFADTLMGHLIVHQTGRLCATISLTSEFISGGAAGDWLEGRAWIKKTTKSLAFAGAEIFAQDKLLMSATSVFKMFPAAADKGPADPAQR